MAPGRRPRLTTLGFDIPGTGLTRVMRTLTARLSDRFEIDRLGIGGRAPPRTEGGVRMHPTNPRGGDAFGALQALEMA